MALEPGLYKIMRDIKACTDFEMIEVKVSTIFSCTVGFPPYREGR